MDIELLTGSKNTGLRLSTEVAEMLEVKHKNLLRKIDNLNLRFNGLNFDTSKYWVKTTYQDKKNETRRAYAITKDGCIFLAHKTTGKKGVEFTLAYMEKYEEMKQKLSKPIKAINAIEAAELFIKQQQLKLK